ncbi:TetR/AcrR family transcriptional regulator [Streptomyces sp. Ag109_O5-10]|uniref:TetR/AcrR family transcriptional regulator n=1 Tax=Streptomyces sp. Ag109_O5-10 TaxID=1855349 RepID=UPI00089C08ED|nr:TetR/AcrR family transcriptional regulator [Streptomyces sp. Ag109_O5-10]SEE23741.1 DNA-binding transcriptional regulator, AcrR family [Streptomyces sp. Ag109_O5-10]
MPRPRSDDKRAAIMAAATRIIAAQGLGAATAAIAKEAGVSNGSLFTYFDTKADLLNQLYLELKGEMGAAALGGLPAADARTQMLHMWSRWMDWATANPLKRRTLAHLQVSDEVTASTHESANRAMTGIAEILERSRANGPMRDTPAALVFALSNALAEATIDYIIGDPDRADEHKQSGFDALWRMIG